MYTTKLPKIFFCGPSLTALDFMRDLISLHPDAFISEHRNYKFLIDKKRYNQELPLYSQQYKAASPDQKSVEFSDHYLSFSKDWARRLETIHSFHLKELRFVIVLKNPFLVFSERVLDKRNEGQDLYVEQIFGRETDSFIKEELRNYNLDNLFLYPSLVSDHIKHLLSRFNRNQFTFITERELMGSTQTFMNKLTHFLGLSPFLLGQEHHEIFGKEKPDEIDGYWKASNADSFTFYSNLSDEVKARLNDYYHKEIKELGQLIDINLNAWFDPKFQSKPASFLSGFGFLNF